MHYYCSFFSSATLASAFRLASLRSHPRVINGFGSKSANKYLHTISITQQPAKSAIMTPVSFTLNYTRESDELVVNHTDTKYGAYHSLHLHDLKPPVQLWEKIRRTRKRDRTRPDEAPIQLGVFTDPFPEGATLEIDRECRDLL